MEKVCRSAEKVLVLIVHLFKKGQCTSMNIPFKEKKKKENVDAPNCSQGLIYIGSPPARCLSALKDCQTFCQLKNNSEIHLYSSHFCIYRHVNMIV